MSEPKSLSANEICKIILAGKDANCSKITYNGLSVEFTGQPEPVNFEYSLSSDTPTPLDLASQENHKLPNNDAADMDYLMAHDPVEFERRIQEVDLNVKR